MKKKIYIASSWKNQHGVEMLTALLRNGGYEVISWVENNYGENHNHVTKKFQFEDWVNSIEADQSFRFDTNGAVKSDLVIYYGPSGKDACAEMGAAWASGVPILGLYAKGEDLGLMRKMAKQWFSRYTDLIEHILNHYPNKKAGSEKTQTAIPVEKSAPKPKYSDVDLEEFKKNIEKIFEHETGQLNFLRGLNDNGSGTFTEQQIKQMLLKQSAKIAHLTAALKRISDGSYGICIDSGKLIDKKELLKNPILTKLEVKKEEAAV